MATATHISLEEYLTTEHEPDVEYVDGQIEERNVGEYDHQLVVAAITTWLNRHGGEWNIRSIFDVRNPGG